MSSQRKTAKQIYDYFKFIFSILSIRKKLTHPESNKSTIRVFKNKIIVTELLTRPEVRKAVASLASVP